MVSMAAAAVTSLAALVGCATFSVSPLLSFVAISHKVCSSAGQSILTWPPKAMLEHSSST